MEHVMDIVIKTVNWIRSRALNHRQFSTLLDEMDAQYGCLIYYSEVRWLSRGAVLQKFFLDCFMKSKNKFVPELTNNDWIKDLAFLVDITAHLNILNLQSQRKNKVITNMYDSISSFMMKLRLWETQLSLNNLVHFSTLKQLSTDGNDEHVKEDLQLELIDLQCNSVLKSKFETVGVPEIFKYLGNSYQN
ncbi:general transcription factor II-I repeat domain-containing protein 2B-like [Acyrthosiphon pisum]|uniref:Uncharacterized protein n=1 Tax=Acyrthosiphon pisum TaxID=7029 RepID=A0A8R2B7L4_ACYPI|nr:general transcription factor II-I repeat domain-containing protein 2B-like [Acyrthosiphon pisum]|eukprot:XP_008185087.1 PREDICTED: general transcription factor II-I repeat domain-containing protein 2B-like [Acyrthosiphon pisum]